jgi:hypothetical protein
MVKMHLHKMSIVHALILISRAVELEEILVKSEWELTPTST